MEKFKLTKDFIKGFKPYAEMVKVLSSDASLATNKLRHSTFKITADSDSENWVILEAGNWNDQHPYCGADLIDVHLFLAFYPIRCSKTYQYIMSNGEKRKYYPNERSIIISMDDILTKTLCRKLGLIYEEESKDENN